MLLQKLHSPAVVGVIGAAAVVIIICCNTCECSCGAHSIATLSSNCTRSERSHAVNRESFSPLHKQSKDAKGKGNGKGSVEWASCVGL